MLKYILKRILWMIPVMLGVLLIVFTISYFTPGDPVIAILGANVTPEAYAAKAAELGLDKPFFGQFFNYLKNIILHFDFGNSYLSKISVSSELVKRFPVSLKIGILGVLLTIIIGIPLGIISATKQYSALDYISSTLAIICAAIPNFCLALYAILIFCVKLKILPITGLATPAAWILPIVCNCISGVAVVTRMTRTSMLEVVRQDYIRTARAKGLTEKQVLFRHALPNALISVITVIGTQMSLIVAGSVIIEQIFAIKGVGSYLLSGIIGRDYNSLNGSVLLLSFFVCVMNLLTDIAYALVDPRIKAQYTGRKKKQTRSDRKTELGSEV